MRYFTLSAVCMLVFCMLLALSGTTDFPGIHHESVPSSYAVSLASGLTENTQGQAGVSAVSPAGDSRPFAGPNPGKEEQGMASNRPLLLLGFLLVAAWVFISFRLFSDARS